jgi:hypothetical protein
MSHISEGYQTDNHKLGDLKQHKHTSGGQKLTMSPQGLSRIHILPIPTFRGPISLGSQPLPPSSEQQGSVSQSFSDSDLLPPSYEDPVVTLGLDDPG